MKIRIDEIPNLDTKSKIEAAVQIHDDELERRNNGENKQFTQHIKIRELHNHISNNLSWEFIDKTLEEEKEADKLEAEEKAEQEKQDRIILAKTDPVVRDSLITELMNTGGFTSEKIALAQVQELKDGKDLSQFWLDRESKLAEIKAMIGVA